MKPITKALKYLNTKGSKWTEGVFLKKAFEIAIIEAKKEVFKDLEQDILSDYDGLATIDNGFNPYLDLKKKHLKVI